MLQLHQTVAEPLTLPHILQLNEKQKGDKVNGHVLIVGEEKKKTKPQTPENQNNHEKKKPYYFRRQGFQQKFWSNHMKFIFYFQHLEMWILYEYSLNLFHHFFLHKATTKSVNLTITVYLKMK